MNTLARPGGLFCPSCSAALSSLSGSYSYREPLATAGVVATSSEGEHAPSRRSVGRLGAD
jgi:hypothetical protein